MKPIQSLDERVSCFDLLRTQVFASMDLLAAVAQVGAPAGRGGG